MIPWLGITIMWTVVAVNYTIPTKRVGLVQSLV